MEIFKVVIYYISFACVFMLCINTTSAQRSPFKVFLVGDAGEDPVTGETLKNLGTLLRNSPNSAVVFLGDNSYKSSLWGLIPGFKGFDSSRLTQKKVRSQMSILDNYKGYAFFVPGNHDWWNITKLEKAKTKLKMEESFIELNMAQNKSIANPERVFLPKDGNAGPDFIDLNNHSIRIIFIDTYRLIMTAFKKIPQEDYPIEKTFYVAFDSLIHEAIQRHEKVIITGHHPLYAKGPNSRPLRRPNLFGRIKVSNSSFPASSRMAAKMRGILNQYPGVYYASGHVHALEYAFPADKVHYIVSGAGSKTNYVSKEDSVRYQPNNNRDFMLWNTRGFFEIDFSNQSEKIFLYYDNGEKKCEVE